MENKKSRSPKRTIDKEELSRLTREREKINQTTKFENMETNIQNFDFKGTNVRIFINEKGDPEFCAKDVTQILGYSNGKDAIIRHCKSRGVVKRDLPSSSGIQSYSFISESNLYRLILKSEKPEAEPFNDWVTEEVLPSIRKHGIYATEDVMEKIMNDPAFGIRLLTTVQEERLARKKAEESLEIARQEREIDKPKVQYFEEVLKSGNSMPINLIASEFGLSHRQMNNILFQLGVQYRSSGVWILYKKYKDKGYTEIKTIPLPLDEKGNTFTMHHMYWFETGRLFIHDLMKTEKAIELLSAIVEVQRPDKFKIIGKRKKRPNNDPELPLQQTI